MFTSSAERQDRAGSPHRVGPRSGLDSRAVQTTLVMHRTRIALPAIVITAVEPDPIKLGAGATLKISGSGLGPPPGGTVKLDDKLLSVGSWADNQVVATLGEGFPPAEAPSQRLKLAVEREGYSAGAFPVQVELPEP